MVTFLRAQRGEELRSGSASSTYVTAEATAVRFTRTKTAPEAGIGATSAGRGQGTSTARVQSRLGRIGELSCR